MTVQCSRWSISTQSCGWRAHFCHVCRQRLATLTTSLRRRHWTIATADHGHHGSFHFAKCGQLRLLGGGPSLAWAPCAVSDFEENRIHIYAYTYIYICLFSSLCMYLYCVRIMPFILWLIFDACNLPNLSPPRAHRWFQGGVLASCGCSQIATLEQFVITTKSATCHKFGWFNDTQWVVNPY